MAKFYPSYYDVEGLQCLIDEYLESGDPDKVARAQQAAEEVERWGYDVETQEQADTIALALDEAEGELSSLVTIRTELDHGPSVRYIYVLELPFPVRAWNVPIPSGPLFTSWLHTGEADFGPSFSAGYDQELPPVADEKGQRTDEGLVYVLKKGEEHLLRDIPEVREYQERQLQRERGFRDYVVAESGNESPSLADPAVAEVVSKWLESNTIEAEELQADIGREVYDRLADSLEPVTLGLLTEPDPERPGEKRRRRLTYDNLVAWTAYELAQRRARQAQPGDDHHAELARLIASACLGIPTISNAPAKLEADIIPRDRLFHVFGGFLDIATKEELGGVYEYKFKRSDGSRYFLESTPAIARVFFENHKHGANEHTLVNVWNAVNELAKRPESQPENYDEASRRIIGNNCVLTTNQILEAILNTADPFDRRRITNTEAHDLVFDAMLTLNGSTLHRFKGSSRRFKEATFQELQNSGGKSWNDGTLTVLKANHRPEGFRDRNGNIIRDVWLVDVGLVRSPDSLGKNLTYEGTKKPLLTGTTLDARRQAIKRQLELIVSQIRQELYPSRPSLNTPAKAEAKRSYDKLFQELYPAREKLDSRLKNSIVVDMQELLESMAERELKERRPVWLKARSKRDPSKGKGKGAWVTLIVEGRRQQPTKPNGAKQPPKIDLGASERRKSPKKSENQ